MSQHRVTVVWGRGGATFTDGRYSRKHRWEFDGGVAVPGSPSPELVPTPMSDPAAVDPEEAFVAAVSSCHMLWFLSLAAKEGFVVDAYRDEAVGYMERNEAGKLAITRVSLRPEIEFAGEKTPDAAQVQGLHERAHQECFIANSIRTVVVVESAA